jgi:hypothetical protein
MKPHVYTLDLGDQRPQIWHEERHRCPSCGKYQELTPLCSFESGGLTLSQVEDYLEPGSGAWEQSFMDGLMEELRNASVSRVIAAFFCRRCAMLSVCGSQAKASIVLHLRVGEGSVPSR